MQVRVIVLGFGLVLLMNGCANGFSLKYESRTRLDTVSKETEILYLASLEKRRQVTGSFDNEKEKKIAAECGITNLEARRKEVEEFIVHALITLALNEGNADAAIFKDTEGVLPLIPKVLSDTAQSLRKTDEFTKLKNMKSNNFMQPMPALDIQALRNNEAFKKSNIEPKIKALIPQAWIAISSLSANIIIEWIFDEIDKKLREHLKEYTAVYRAKVTPPNFYMQTGSPELLSNCFLFSRFPEEKPEENTKEKPIVALIGQMRITENGDALQIRPLILYQSDAMAKSDDESYGIAASIRMNAVWLQENRGMREETFNYTFLKEKITLSKSKSDLKYFLDKKWEDYPVLPLPPWSTNVGTSSPAGNVEIVISLAESGKPNELLEFIAELFDSERKDLAELLKNAAEAGLP